MEIEKFYRLLELGLEKGASDIHLQVGCLPLYRFHGTLVELRYRELTADDTETIARHLIEATTGETEMSFDEVDLAFELPEQGRFRVNISRQRRLYNIVLRVIPLQIKTFDELNLPSILNDIAQTRRGFVLVTGATGMGKSTTLAAMLNTINETRKTKIITIEDPIEFVFDKKKSVITQREIGQDTESFPKALRAALRQDPDVIMVGEMRDLETVDTALKAAETGHLVFSTIHTSDVVSTISRLGGLLPPLRAVSGSRAFGKQPASGCVASPAHQQKAQRPGARRRGHAIYPHAAGVHQGSGKKHGSSRIHGPGALGRNANLRPAPT